MSNNINKSQYEKFIKKIQIGDIVSLKRKNKKIKIKGEVKEKFFKNEKFYLRLYLLFKRKEVIFLLNNKLELVLPESKNKNADYEPVLYNDLFDKRQKKRTHTNFLKKIIAILILIAFILTINPGIRIPTVSTSFTYKEFLSMDVSIYKLFRIVTTRVKYRYDLGEQWMTPEFAWKNKYGDCEEFASILSDYLSKRKIENYLVGLNIKGSSKGHAVVFIKIDSLYYIIDPTFAKESFGIKKLKNISNLKDAIKMYSSLPVYIYKVPSFNGEKKIIKGVY